MYFARRAAQRLAATSPSTPARTLRTHLPVPRAPHPRRYASKAAPDKDDVHPTSTEYSKTGGGDDAAAHSDEAFNPDTTRPEREAGKGGSGSGGAGALDASPANPEVNRTKREENTSSARSSAEAGDEASGRAATSQRGSPDKQGGR